MKLPRILVVILSVIVLLVGGTLFLMFRDIPAPSQPVEKELPHDKFAN